jgi:hypothetical protein
MEATRLMAQRFLSIKNFEKYQTMKFSTAPWFKLQKSFFGDREVTKLPIESRFLFIGLIYLATECNNKVYNDKTWIAQRLYISPTEVNLTPLYKAGFLNTSNLHRELELSREELSRVEESRGPSPVLVDFDTFWNAYPKKQGKEKARQAWVKLNPDYTLNTLILTRLEQHKGSEQWQRDAGKYIPHASTWLNGKRWEDELTAKPSFSLPKPRPALVIQEPAFKPTIGKDEAESILKRLVPSIGKL